MSAGMVHRRALNVPRNRPDVAIVSDLALIGRCTLAGSFVQDGRSPPFQQIEVPLTRLGMAADHHCLLCRRDIPGRRHVRRRVGRVKQPGDGLGREDDCIASAHGAIVGCRGEGSERSHSREPRARLLP